jgi:hypothetical protein
MNENVTDQILQRVAVLALLYDPAAATADPTYSLAADIQWALEAAGGIQVPERARLSEVIARVILDPTGSRHELVAALHLSRT